MTSNIGTEAATVYRDYIELGIPLSGAKDPVKADIRALHNTIADEVVAVQDSVVAALAEIDVVRDDIADLVISQQSGVISYLTYAELEANVLQPVGATGNVTNDGGNHTDPVTAGNPTVLNQGVYRWSASPAGWQWIAADVPFTARDGLITNGQSTLGAALLKDSSGNHALTYDPTGGRAVIDGDLTPVGPMRVVLAVGKSQWACGAVNAASMPSIHSIPLRKKRLFMFASCGTIGLQSTNILSLDTRKVVALFEGWSADLWDQPALPAEQSDCETFATGMLTQLLAYQDARRMVPRAYVFLNCALSGAQYANIRGSENNTLTEQLPFQNEREGLKALKKIFGQIIVEFVSVDQGSGETDLTAVHVAHMKSFYDDHQVMIKEVTGQVDDIPLFLTSPATYTVDGSGVGFQDAVIELHTDATAAALVITAISKTATVVITYTGTDPANGDRLWSDSSIVGMIEMRDRALIVSAVNAGANTFEVAGLDSSGFETYLSGGRLTKRKIHATNPQHQEPYADLAHLHASARPRLGGQMGRAIADTLWGAGSGVFWMTGATITDTDEITITTNALTDLVFGSIFHVVTTNKGFHLQDAALVTKAITSVTPVGTTIVIVATGAAATWIVNFARLDTNASGAVGPGATGEVRDSRPDRLALDDRNGVEQWMLPCARTVT